MPKFWKVISRSAVITSMLLSQNGTAQTTSQVLEILQGNNFLKLSNTVLETARMRELYQAMGTSEIWVQNGQLTALGQALPGLLKTADRHGLVVSDYWTPLMESLFRNPGGKTAISLELSATETLLRYATDLHAGRLEPNQVDDDIKFTRKKLDIARLAQILKQDAAALATNLDVLAPQIPMYAQLKAHLATLRRQQAATPFPAISIPERDLNVGDSHPMIAKLKQKLKLLGYEITDASEIYDSDLEMAIMAYQSDNGLPIGNKLLVKGAFWRHVAVGMDQRIRQIELSLEKLRWLPNRLEARHIFTNLAFQKFRLYEGGRMIMNMRTINGRPIRRTPSMRDQMTVVELNPTWTVPYSIALRDKIPEIRKSISYLRKARLSILDSNTLETLDPYDIPWDSVNAKTMNFQLVQDAGPNNALGSMKFHLTNPWAIYYHDTNEKNLFSESNRELSSGCIRLEKPMDLAVYLLQDNPRWNSSDKIQEALATSEDDIYDGYVEQKFKIPIKQAIPIYTLYLTAEVTKDNAISFSGDGYGQDARLARMLNARPMKAAGAGLQLGQGELLIRGTPGKGQALAKVTAIRCDRARRWACDEPVVMDLNKATSVAAGSYIVSFENSLNPGWVEVSNGGQTALDLVQVALPAKVQDEASVKVFRDLTNPLEQRKFLWAIYHVGRHPVGLANYEFGDLYLSTSNKKDVMARIAAEYCAASGDLSKLTEEGRDVCRTVINAKNFQQLAGNYEFKTDSSVVEKFVTAPGDWVRVQHKRHLVSMPITGRDFISVFPGAYRAMADGQKSSNAFTTGQVRESY